MGKMKHAKKLKRPEVDNSRKTQRKQKRLQKKVHRQEHYLKKKTLKEQPEYTPGKFVKRPADNKKIEKEVKKKKPKPQPSVQDILNKEREKDLRDTKKLKTEMNKRRHDMLLEANEDEDKMIKKLEKQLGLNKSKNKNNYFADDGLDYLLEICDRSTTEQIVAAEKHLAEVEGDSDFDEDLATVTGKELTKKDKKTKKKEAKADDDSKIDDDESDLDDDNNEMDNDNSEMEDDKIMNGNDFGEESNDDSTSDEEEDNDDGEIDDNSDDSEEPGERLNKLKKSKANTSKTEKDSKLKVPETKPKTKERVVKAEDLSKVFSDDEISHLSGDEDMEGFSDEDMGDEDDEVDDNKKEEKPDVWEDIYGRKRDKEGNIIKEEKGIYIPPHLRNKDSASDKQLAHLKRQIKSVLNKLAGTNLHWACTSIENLYATNSRNSVNSALTDLWVEATVSPSVTPDRLVTEHAALVAVLHANVGSEIGAHFLQELAKKLDVMLQSPQPMEDKRMDNLVVCLAHLYNFKIFEYPVICDILSRLLTSLTEKHIDCSLAMFRCAGATLRKAAPRQLQELVQLVQAAAANISHTVAAGSRIKFLLEVLLAIKNNNLQKIPGYDPSYQEQLKKMVKTVVRKGNYITPLNIGLEDLLKAEERGKWWVVGSAWEGSGRQQAAPSAAPPAAADQKLLELARKQRMNTDLRRNIFCIIMAAEDYMDAFEKLQHLGLKGQQEREIIHVLLACCLQERQYNPYYAVLGHTLCLTSRKYQLSIQFAVWDKIKDLENQSKQCATNLAQFLVHLIMEKGLPLSILKVIQFSDLNKHYVRFMRQILLSIIMNENLQSSLEVFHRISKPPKLHMFRESLKLFIQHFLVKNAGKKSNVLSDHEMVTLKERATEVDKILTMYESKLKF